MDLYSFLIDVNQCRKRLYQPISYAYCGNCKKIMPVRAANNGYDYRPGCPCESFKFAIYMRKHTTFLGTIAISHGVLSSKRIRMLSVDSYHFLGHWAAHLYNTGQWLAAMALLNFCSCRVYSPRDDWSTIIATEETILD